MRALLDHAWHVTLQSPRMDRTSIDPPSPRDYDVLDHALRAGSVTVTNNRQCDDVRGNDGHVQNLCDRGLMCQLFRVQPTTEEVAIYVITDWGRVVWEREKTRADRAQLRGSGAPSPHHAGCPDGHQRRAL
jgi:hypothetical protein